MNAILDQVNDKFAKGIMNFSEKYGVQASRVQIVIFTEDNESARPRYRLYIDYRPARRHDPTLETSEITYLDIINEPFDGLGLEDTVAEFIAIALQRLSKEIHAEPSQTKIMILTKSDTTGRPLYLLKRDSEDIRQLKLSDDIFGIPSDEEPEEPEAQEVQEEQKVETI